MRRPWAAAFLLVLAAGIGLRLAAALKTDTVGRLRDQGRPDYFEYGRGLREFGVLGRGGKPSAFRGPVYPVFLGSVERFDLDLRPASPLIEAALGSLAIPLAGLAAWQLHSPWAGLAAAALAAFHPALAWPLPACRVEPLYGLLVLLAAVSLAEWIRTPTAGRAAAAGFVLATGLLCRSVLSPFPFILLAGLGARPDWALRWRKTAWILIAAAFAFLLPWIARNAYQFGRFIPFEDHAADRNFIAAASGIVENAPGPSPDGGPEIPFDELGKRRREALGGIIRDPGPYLRSCVLRLGCIVKRHSALSFLAGLAFLRLRGDPAALGLGLLAACFLLMHVPLSLEARYLEPILPTLMVLAGCGAAELGQAAGFKPEAAEARAGQAPGGASRLPLVGAGLVWGVSLAVAGALYLLVVWGLAGEVLRLSIVE
ncbi:MAG: hypothetical protein HY748_03490 [Elusimicrobia bacterium]|nr:hypothetical protein [Elusimicrobiota bacterium]